jgi:ankyrin repeat protein
MRALKLKAQKGHFKAAQLLVANGADMSAATITGYSVIYKACESGSKELVKFLIDNGANVWARSQTDLDIL